MINENWTKPVNDEIDVPDELVPLFNKVGMQFRFVQYSNLNEYLAMAHIVEAARKFFSKNKHLLDNE
jgi:hypothetical protein